MFLHYFLYQAHSISDLTNITEISFEPGTYFINETIKITKNNTKIYGKGEVRLIGGVKITKYHKVQDLSIMSIMNKDIKDQVYEIDLKENGITEINDFYPTGFGYSRKYSHNHLYIDQQQMNFATYPSMREFIKFTSPETAVPIKNGLGINDSRVFEWNDSRNILAWGYWNYG